MLMNISMNLTQLTQILLNLHIKYPIQIVKDMTIVMIYLMKIILTKKNLYKQLLGLN
jgi:hypothetical protein